MPHACGAPNIYDLFSCSIICPHPTRSEYLYRFTGFLWMVGKIIRSKPKDKTKMLRSTHLKSWPSSDTPLQNGISLPSCHWMRIPDAMAPKASPHEHQIHNHIHFQASASPQQDLLISYLNSQQLVPNRKWLILLISRSSSTQQYIPSIFEPRKTHLTV